MGHIQFVVDTDAATPCGPRNPGHPTVVYLTAEELDAWLAGIRDSLARVETADGPRWLLPQLGRFRLPVITAAERDAGTWELGDMIYASDLDAVQARTLGGWTTL